MKKYVIQYRKPIGRNPGTSPWETSVHQFDTLEEAKTYYDTLPFKSEWRIAEAYVQVRYKPVKEELYKPKAGRKEDT